jgi:DNA-binding NarL/FixJ family response regulator
MKQPQNILLAGGNNWFTEMVSREMEKHSKSYCYHHTDVLQQSWVVVGNGAPLRGIACFNTQEEGLKTMEAVKVHYPTVSFIAFTAWKNEEDLIALYKCGYRGVLFPDELNGMPEALKDLEEKDCCPSPKMYPLLANPAYGLMNQKIPLSSLKTKMNDTLYRLCECFHLHPEWSNKQVAKETCKSSRTVDNQMPNVYEFFAAKTKIDFLLELRGKYCIG